MPGIRKLDKTGVFTQSVNAYPSIYSLKVSRKFSFLVRKIIKVKINIEYEIRERKSSFFDSEQFVLCTLTTFRIAALILFMNRTEASDFSSAFHQSLCSRSRSKSMNNFMRFYEGKESILPRVRTIEVIERLSARVANTFITSKIVFQYHSYKGEIFVVVYSSEWRLRD